MKEMKCTKLYRKQQPHSHDTKGFQQGQEQLQYSRAALLPKVRTSFPLTTNNSQTTVSMQFLRADSSNPSLWKMHVKPQNHILTQGQQDHPLDCSQQQLAIVPHYFCSFSPHPDNARGQVSKGLFTNHMITRVRGFLQNQGLRRNRKLCRVTKGKQQEKEKGERGYTRG